MLDAHLDVLETVRNGRTMLFPTFNYDFCRTGNFSVASDPSQVGALSEHARLRFSQSRTHTPVFNFVQVGEPRVTQRLATNPFDSESTFGELVRLGATVAFYGAPFAANTFVHHVEELRGIGYRFLKAFPGRVWIDNGYIETVLRYRVRPLEADGLVYDWPRLMADMRVRSLLRSVPIGRSVMHSFRADKLLQFWGDRLATDEFYLLTEGARLAVQRLARKYGYPFLLSGLEVEGSRGIM